jgi:peptidoglycan/xylan/chitin deacetylase (PgdA/CDA1 family)
LLSDSIILINLGAISDDKGAYIRSLGYKIINWNIDTVDWDSGSTTQTILENTKNGLRLNNKGIILMHDHYRVTHEALPGIINHLRSESYNIVSIDECL